MRNRITTIDTATQAQRIIRVLSELYDISYAVVRAYYYRYQENVQATKLRLNLIYQTGLELEQLEIIN
jgi:hypothetical protein